jgi:hypothetical protein
MFIYPNEGIGIRLNIKRWGWDGDGMEKLENTANKDK